MRKNQLYITIGNFVYLLAQWALTVVVVRLSTDFYMAGLLGLAMTVANIFFIIASYGLRSYQVSDVQHVYADQSYTLSRAITVPVSIILCAAYAAMKGYEGESILVILLYMLYKALEAASDVLYGIMQQHNQYGKICLSMSFKGIFSLAVFTGALAAGMSISMAIICMVAVAVVTLICMDIRWCLPLSHPLISLSKENIKKTGKLLLFASPMVILAIAQPLLMSIPRLYFEQHYSTELLGIYSSLSSPTLAITTLVSCALMPYIPLFAQYYTEGDSKRLFRLTFLSLGLTLAFGAAAYAAAGLIGPWVLAILYGSSAAGYNPVFQLIIIVSTLSSVNMCLIVVFTAIRKLIAQSVVLLLGCLLCYLITPGIVTKFAMEGVTYSLMIAQGFQIAIATALVVYYIRKIPKAKVVPPEQLKGDAANV